MKNRAAAIYDFTLPANGSFVLPVEGSYYRILTATGAVQVRRDGGSGLAPLFPGQGEKDQNYNRLTITDKSGAGNVGTIIVGDSTFVDDRVTGEVSIIDGSKSRTLANNAFSASILVNAVAAQYSHAQLWNPTTTKNIVVGQILLSSATAITVVLRAHNAALSTLYANQPNPASKRIGASDSTMESRLQNAAAGIPTGKFLGNLALQANSTVAYKLTEPIIVPPGQGLTMYALTLNTDLNAIVETYEEAV